MIEVALAMFLAIAHHQTQHGALLSLTDIQQKNLDNDVDPVRETSPGVHSSSTVANVLTSFYFEA